MDARLTNLGELPLVLARGDIDHSNCRTIEKLLDEAIQAGNQIVFLDLQHVTYVDSGGLSVLFSAARRLRDGGWLGLVAPNSSVHRLLEIVGVLADPGFRVFSDQTAAEQATSAGPDAK